MRITTPPILGLGGKQLGKQGRTLQWNIPTVPQQTTDALLFDFNQKTKKKENKYFAIECNRLHYARSQFNNS